ncbi:hypothetical protein C7S13_5086 [Burkholderia cepacia]|nr:hypothetical protein [Burkholderia cepacia]
MLSQSDHENWNEDYRMIDSDAGRIRCSGGTEKCDSEMEAAD